MYTKAEKIKAVRWMYGFTAKEAEEYVKGFREQSPVLDELIKVWHNQATKSFKED